MEGFEGEWGFVSSEPSDAWMGSGLRGGVGACGAPKALLLSIRREPTPDGGFEWRLRTNPNQPIGHRVIAVEKIGERQRLTASFLHEVEVFEMDGDRLTTIMGSVRLKFERCRHD